MNRLQQSIGVVVLLGIGLVVAVAWALLPSAAAQPEVVMVEAAVSAKPAPALSFAAANPEVMKASHYEVPASEAEPGRLESVQRFSLAETLAAKNELTQRANEAMAARYTGLAESLTAENDTAQRANAAITARYTGLAESLTGENDTAQRANAAITARYTGLAESLTGENDTAQRANAAITARYTGLAESLGVAPAPATSLADNPELLKIGR